MDRLLELTARAERSHFWFRGFRWFVRPELIRAVASLREPRLLDCGCGTGANLAMLGELGRACGFDFNWTGLQIARQSGRAVARATLGSIPFRDETFDVVTSFDVLQCVTDEVEQAGIRELSRVLKPGGHLILNVAALEILSGGHAVLSAERRRYTPARVRGLVQSAGFTVERLTFVHATLFPLLLPVRLLQRWRGGGAADESDITVPWRPVNALLTAVARAEATALRVVDMPVGSSILCHARKPAVK
jgi:SAM-dependent methyltransferase